MERHLPAQADVEDGAERVDVGARPDRADVARRLLGRHVVGRAEDVAGLTQPILSIQLLGQAEVGDLRLTIGREQDIGGLEVAMNDAVLMGMLHGAGQLFDQRCRLARGEADVFAKPLRQRTAGQKLEREVGIATVFAEIVDMHDAGMLHLGDRGGFEQETGALVRSGMFAGEDHLERDFMPERAMSGTVDDPHAAAGQQLDHLVAGDFRELGGRVTVRHTDGRRQQLRGRRLQSHRGLPMLQQRFDFGAKGRIVLAQPLKGLHALLVGKIEHVVEDFADALPIFLVHDPTRPQRSSRSAPAIVILCDACGAAIQRHRAESRKNDSRPRLLVELG